MIEQQLVSLYSNMHGRNRDHSWDFGSMSCIPLHFSTHGLFGRRLRRWGSTGSWVRWKPRRLLFNKYLSKYEDIYV